MLFRYEALISDLEVLIPYLIFFFMHFSLETYATYYCIQTEGEKNTVV